MKRKLCTGYIRSEIKIMENKIMHETKNKNLKKKNDDEITELE